MKLLRAVLVGVGPFEELVLPFADDNGEARPITIVHGGGGKAFPAWAEHWAGLGCVIDLQSAACLIQTIATKLVHHAAALFAEIGSPLSEAF